MRCLFFTAAEWRNEVICHFRTDCSLFKQRRIKYKKVTSAVTSKSKEKHLSQELFEFY
jgi:hypothetical protein